MEALTAFVPLVGVILGIIGLVVLTGIVSRSSMPALRYWSLHPWRFFWLSYVIVFAGLLLLKVSWPTAFAFLAPGMLLMVTSAIQGFRVAGKHQQLDKKEKRSNIR